MTIRLRILLACLSLASLTGLLGVFTLHGEQQLGAIAIRMYDASFMSVDFFRAAQTDFAELHGRFASVQGDRDVTIKDPRLPSIVASIADDLDVAVEHATSDAARQTAAVLRNHASRLQQDLSDAHAIARTLQVMASLFETGAEQFAQDGFQARLQAEATARRSELASKLAIAASTMVAVLITLVLSRSIVPPLRAATRIASEIAEGNLDNAIDARGRSEISMLMRALRIMQSALAERREAARRIEHMACHDSLTDLANRIAFGAAIEHAVSGARDGGPFKLLLLDLDRFKTVNDTLGHPAGDGVLCVVASRMRACMREGDTAARLGGDEFAVVQLSDIEDTCRQGSGDENMENGPNCQLAERLLASISAPYQISGHVANIGVSIGIASSWPGCTAEEMLRRADRALYEAKHAGRGRWRIHGSNPDAPIARADADPGGSARPPPTPQAAAYYEGARLAHLRAMPDPLRAAQDLDLPHPSNASFAPLTLPAPSVNAG